MTAETNELRDRVRARYAAANGAVVRMVLAAEARFLSWKADLVAGLGH